jgi:hypothetical protein
MNLKKLNSGKFELTIKGSSFVLSQPELLDLYLVLKDTLDTPSFLNLEYEVPPPVLTPEFFYVRSRVYKPELTSSLKTCYNEVCGTQ